MAVKIDHRVESIYVTINEKRVSGDNRIFHKIINDENIDENINSITIDISLVEYVNSLGIAEFISIYRHLKHVSNGELKMRIVNISKNIYNIFKLVELNAISELIPKQSNPED